MRKKELEQKVDDLESVFRVLRDRLIDAKVLRRDYQPHMSIDAGKPISLTNLQGQIELIKDFLGIELITEPAIAAKNKMVAKLSNDNEEKY